MRPVQSLLLKISRMGEVHVIKQPSMQSIKKQLNRSALEPHQQRRFLQNLDQWKVDRKASTLQSMREFFMHPLTWDRNNGYLNVVLALSIFGLCFINSCSPCPEDVPPQRKTEE